MSMDEQNSKSSSSATISATTAIPEWIKAPLFEPVFKEIHPSFRQTKEFKVSPALGAGENYVTIMLRIEAVVELKDNSTQTVSLMIKTSNNSEIFKKFMENNNVFDVEASMYEQVVPEMEELYRNAGEPITFGPKCYKLNTDEPYILLEDLKRHGFRNANRLEGLDAEHIQIVLHLLAKWHAASAVRMATKGLYEKKFSHGFFNEGSRAVMKSMMDGLASIFLDCIQEYDLSEELFEALSEKQKNYVDDMFDILGKVDPEDFNILNHGDCWSNNIMFQYDDEGKIKETYLIDYQVPRYGAPAQDLLYFLISSAEYDLKTKNFDSFIKYYHDELTRNLKLLNYSKNIPSLKDIHILLFKYGFWGYTTSSGVMAAILLDPHEDASIDNWLSDSDVAVNFKAQMFSNPRYRKHMEMILPWLYYRGALE